MGSTPRRFGCRRAGIAHCDSPGPTGDAGSAACCSLSSRSIRDDGAAAHIRKEQGKKDHEEPRTGKGWAESFPLNLMFLGKIKAEICECRPAGTQEVGCVTQWVAVRFICGRTGSSWSFFLAESSWLLKLFFWANFKNYFEGIFNLGWTMSSVKFGLFA